MNSKIKELLEKRNINIDESITHNPFLFNDMQKAVNIIKNTINNNEMILICGDYDVDGMSSTACISKHLMSMGGKVLSYIPNRIKDGYGLSQNVLGFITENNVKLVITCDNGITANDVIKQIRLLGVKVIVTDHHEPGEKLPECECILDAKCEGNGYPFKELCGAGVVLKLIEALSGQAAINNYIEAVALATVSDVVPLVDENRTIVKQGLLKMNTNPSYWVESLKNAQKINGEITSRHLGFNFAPVINSCGRLADARMGAILLRENDRNKIDAIVSDLLNVNEKRKQIEEIVTNQININTEDRIIIAAGNWHEGVIGIAAARIVEKTQKPCILFSYNKETREYKGSGRSIDGINLFELISKCSSFVKKFGGHKAAAGLTIEEGQFDYFCYKIKSLVDFYNSNLFKKKLKYDFRYYVSDIDDDLMDSLALMEPTGKGNETPLFLIKNVVFNKVTPIPSTRPAFVCQIVDGQKSIRAIAFNRDMPIESTGDVVVTLDYYNGEKVCRIIDLEENTIDYNEIINTTNFSTRTIPLSLESLGISDKKITQFNNAGIYNCDDLLKYFPTSYYDFRKPVTADKIPNKDKCSIIGRVLKVNTKSTSTGGQMVTCACQDENSKVFYAMWFNQPYVARLLTIGVRYIFCGSGYVNEENGYSSINVLYFSSNIEKYKAIIPVYKKIKGMSAEYLNESISKALSTIPNTDYLEKDLVEKFTLIPTKQSVLSLHHPKTFNDIDLAQKRQVFDELFRFNLILQNNSLDNKPGTPPEIKNLAIIDEFKKIIPYTLTNDQNNTIYKICNDMIVGKMVNALVQGDVGCGKSIVAFMLAAVVSTNHHQACIVAPTEVLAQQHYDEFKSYADILGIKTAYLSGTTKVREKKTILKELFDGSIQVVIGTHAILQETVVFNDLGLAIVDEQHKFGVSQRDALTKTGKRSHIVTMSATPIPRTLALATFGENIEMYNINSKPVGRKPVITICSKSDKETYNFILKEVQSGHQAYIVCPAIDSSEKLDTIESVSKTIEKVKSFFAPWPDIKVSGINGRMKAESIEEEITKFKNNETQILISTTIIEVGINVPNATVITIKSSDRFGLAQAHQLRGRVGRGQDQAYCILQPNDINDRKARILCSTNDGFEIAKFDLEMRGTGDFIGTSQSGFNKATSLMISEPELYRKISDENKSIIGTSRLELYKFLLEENENPT